MEQTRGEATLPVLCVGRAKTCWPRAVASQVESLGRSLLHASDLLSAVAVLRQQPVAGLLVDAAGVTPDEIAALASLRRRYPELALGLFPEEPPSPRSRQALANGCLAWRDFSLSLSATKTASSPSSLFPAPETRATPPVPPRYDAASAILTDAERQALLG